MELETLYIRTNKGTCVVNGKELKNVSALEFYLNDGRVSLNVTHTIECECPVETEEAL